MSDTLNVIALVRDKKNDKFIFLYDEESVSSLYDQIQVLADDKELGLTLQEVVVICRKIKELQAANASGCLDFE